MAPLPSHCSIGYGPRTGHADRTRDAGRAAVDDDQQRIRSARLVVGRLVQHAVDRRAVGALPRDHLAVADLPAVDLVAEAGQLRRRATFERARHRPRERRFASPRDERDRRKVAAEAEAADASAPMAGVSGAIAPSGMRRDRAGELIPSRPEKRMPAGVQSMMLGCSSKRRSRIRPRRPAPATTAIREFLNIGTAAASTSRTRSAFRRATTPVRCRARPA